MTPTSLSCGIIKIVREPSIQLAALETHWARIKKKIEKRRRTLAQRIPPDDPIKLSVDLLTPIGCDTDENLYTQALAYLCDERNEHDLQRSVLICILRKIKTLCPRGSTAFSAAGRALYMMDRKGAIIDPRAEYKHDTGRSDVWITLRHKQNHALIVIENKIGAHVRAEQLAGYRNEAQSWCKHHHAPPPLLVLLTRKDEEKEKENWVNLTYLQLASALRQVWMANKNSTGAPWLGLYISSITAGVLDIDVKARPQDFKRTDIESYLDEILVPFSGETLMTKKLSIPAISREFDFYVRNASIVDEIFEDANVEQSLRELTEVVYDRAEETMNLLLRNAQTTLRAVVGKFFRADWQRRLSREEWEWWSPIYSPGRGPRRRIGSAGLYVSFREKEPTLVGWVRLRGGAKRQDELLGTADSLDGVVKEDNYVCWFKKPLKLNTTRAEVQRDIKRQAGAFFKRAKPVLR